MTGRWMTGIGVLFISLVLAFGTGRAAEEKPIKLGVVFIMSGSMGGYGKHGTQAIQLALDEINAQGGILGRKVEAIFEDDELKVDRACRSLRSLLLRTKWILLLDLLRVVWPWPWLILLNGKRRSWS